MQNQAFYGLYCLDGVTLDDNDPTTEPVMIHKCHHQGGNQVSLQCNEKRVMCVSKGGLY